MITRVLFTLISTTLCAPKLAFATNELDRAAGFVFNLYSGGALLAEIEGETLRLKSDFENFKITTTLEAEKNMAIKRETLMKERVDSAKKTLIHYQQLNEQLEEAFPLLIAKKEALKDAVIKNRAGASLDETKEQLFLLFDDQELDPIKDSEALIELFKAHQKNCADLKQALSRCKVFIADLEDIINDYERAK